MSDTRRFDSLEKTVSDTARSLDEKTSTLFQRVADHKHDAADVASGTLDVARVPTGRTSTTVSLGNHNHNRDAIGETRYNYVESSIEVPSTSYVTASLNFAVTSLGAYLYEAFLFYTSPPGDDFRVYVSTSSGITGTASVLGRDPASTTSTGEGTWNAPGLNAGIVVGGLTSPVQFCMVTAVFGVPSTTGHSVGLFVSKNGTSSTVPASLAQRSCARITRLA